MNNKRVWLITMYGVKWHRGFYDGPSSQTVYVIGRSRAKAIEIAQRRTKLEPFVTEVAFSQLEECEKEAFDANGVAVFPLQNC